MRHFFSAKMRRGRTPGVFCDANLPGLVREAVSIVAITAERKKQKLAEVSEKLGRREILSCAGLAEELDDDALFQAVKATSERLSALGVELKEKVIDDRLDRMLVSTLSQPSKESRYEQFFKVRSRFLKEKKTIGFKDRWNEEKPFKLSYRQALRYVRLADFLTQYPRIMYQSAIVDLQPLLDVGDLELNEAQKAFWSVDPLNIKVAPLDQSFELHVDGLEIRRACFNVEPGLADQMYESLGHSALQIFNNAGIGEESDDARRAQHPIDSFDLLAEWVATNFPNHQMADTVLLVSKPGGCLPQRAHTDYRKEAFCKVAVPLCCLLALEDNTPFDTWPGAINFDSSVEREHCTVILNRGDLLVFRGDLVHAGAAFGQRNVRIHAYLDVPGVDREKDVTCYMDGEEYILPRGQKCASASE